MRLGVAVLRHPSRLARTPLAGLAVQPAAWLRRSLRRETARPAPDQSGRQAEDTPHAAITVVLVSLVLLAALFLSVLEVWLAIPAAPPAVAPELGPASCGDGDPGLPTRSERSGAPARIGPAFTC